MAAAYCKFDNIVYCFTGLIPATYKRYLIDNIVYCLVHQIPQLLFHLENFGSCTNKLLSLEQEMKQQNSFKSRTVHLILIMLINHSKKQNLDMYLQPLPSQAPQN